MPYATVILPLAAPGEYTYEIPEELIDQVKPGMRVEVQFGPKRVYAAIVKCVMEEYPFEYSPKLIINVLDDEPILYQAHLKFWSWMADYYMCTEGEVMNAALPTAFKLSSETVLVLNPSFSHDYSLLSDQEYLVVEALTIQEEISIADVQSILERKKVYHIIKSLIEKGVLFVKEILKEKYKPKTASFVHLTEENVSDEAMQGVFDKVAKAPKQQAILLAYLHFSPNRKEEILKSKVLKKADADNAAMKALIKKGIFIEEKKAVDRVKQEQGEQTESFDLSEQQANALSEIRNYFEEQKVVLLHGVTSSGKTQLYIELIKDAITEEKQTLYLLPEIALTAQMIGRLKKVFGNEIGIYHSKFNAQERVEIWHKVRRGDYKIVIGARSALFLPFVDLGLVIVDEEHDPSYKQRDPAPRYNGRDAAIFLAHQNKAKVILGSATPAFESYQNALRKKYGLVRLTERYGGVLPPEVRMIDLREARKSKSVKSQFSDGLLSELEQALGEKEQAIIFQNRRGYAPFVACDTCDWVPRCVQCDVTLTYHKYANELKCHYCNYRKKIPSNCPECKSPSVTVQGFGTEKIQEELGIYFHEHKIGRLDLETARGKNSHTKIINSFEAQDLDILVGTQMVTKGLDFDNVTKVGIINANMLINFPDFRAGERAFQLLMQVSGRAGRRSKRGKVIIQSTDPTHILLEHLLKNDYEGYFQIEMWERQQFFYPPFSRLIKITIKHRDKDRINDTAFEFTKLLKAHLPKQEVLILGPAVPAVSRIRNFYLREVLLKMGKSGATMRLVKDHLRAVMAHFKKEAKYKAAIIQMDVDP